MPSTVLKILHRYLDDQEIRGQLSVTYPDGKTRSYGKGDGESVHVEVTTWPVLWRIALSPDPGVAEAYMDGELIFRQGDPATLLKLI